MRPEDGEALGSGSAGAVFALPSDEGDVAFKVFPGRLYERTRLRLEHELERLSALGGQVLVPEVIEELPDGRCALRSELCTRSLLDLVESTGPLSVADTLVLGSAIASTLARAHESGIVHGRLTPANVLFRASGEPVINDFERTLRPVFVRDPDHGSDFLAPEGPHGEDADLYGLGAVLHFALTGLPPGPDRPELHRVDAPIDLLSLIENLLAEDPDSRPSGMAVVEEILIALTPAPSTMDEELPVVVSRGIQGYPLLTIAPEPAPAPEPRKRSAWPVLAIGAATVLATAAWFLIPGSPEPVPQAQAQPSPPKTSTNPKPAPRVELDAPIDHGSMVELTWRAPEGFDSAVVVADGTGEAKTTIVRQQRTMKIPVDPGRKYCFLVQITDGGDVRESAPRPIRGAVCRK
ncbi:protein kinase [Amycolatopsis roodepoortensis]|uniref:protein kinase domain-containing protein n=1 Tax=Amycolatopsis roodepoortensis TaxID=700274 RepID=UPI00214CF671|nr:protein kinase [Amycolatopsis roodepoortensis]UUV30819.1 protein kinase [Amycolatopsis roodepoortensis]